MIRHPRVPRRCPYLSQSSPPFRRAISDQAFIYKRDGSEFVPTAAACHRPDVVNLTTRQGSYDRTDDFGQHGLQSDIMNVDLSEDNPIYSPLHLPNEEESREGSSVKFRTDTPQTPMAELAKTLRSQSCLANFTVSGCMPVLPHAAHDADGDLTPRTASQVKEQTVYPRPVTVRWGTDGAGRMLTLPMSASGDQERLEALVQACTPATFGRGEKNVYDTNYRKAGAMAPGTEFVTDSSPYEAGIMDLVVQCLVPTITGDLGSGSRKIAAKKSPEQDALSRGLRSELYKLNIYSGPSGMFRPHVDTPRSRWQVGSLVVALPVAFEGGDLTVTHGGRTISHSWSASSTTSISWAAFYSDCTHEVLPVTDGHRLTLTYNLFLSKGHGLLCARPSTLLPAQLPLAISFRALLSDPDFMPTGGYLGIHLTHDYPHTDERLYSFVPHMLKGVDMALYTAITRGLDTGGNLTCVLVPSRAGTGVVPYNIFDILDADRGTPGQDDGGEQVPQSLLEPCKIKYEWGEDYSESEDEEGYEGEDGYKRSLRDALDKIIWVNRQNQSKRMRFVGIAYGNYAELSVKYSHVALVVKILRWADRTD